MCRVVLAVCGCCRTTVDYDPAATQTCRDLFWGRCASKTVGHHFFFTCTLCRDLQHLVYSYVHLTCPLVESRPPQPGPTGSRRTSPLRSLLARLLFRRRAPPPRRWLDSLLVSFDSGLVRF